MRAALVSAAFALAVGLVLGWSVHDLNLTLWTLGVAAFVLMEAGGLSVYLSIRAVIGRWAFDRLSEAGVNLHVALVFDPITLSPEADEAHFQALLLAWQAKADKRFHWFADRFHAKFTATLPASSRHRNIPAHRERMARALEAWLAVVVETRTHL